MAAAKVTVADAPGGIGILGLLGIVFIVLKLCGVIAWSWWWVLCPFWEPFAVALLVFVIAMIGSVVV